MRDNTVYPGLMISVGTGGAFGAWFAGFIYDLMGNDVPVFLILIFCALFACQTSGGRHPEKSKWYQGRG